MAFERLEGSEGGPQGEGRPVEPPPFQHPAQARFFDPREPEGRYAVKLTAAATAWIWATWKDTLKTGAWKLVCLNMSGNVEAHFPRGEVQAAMRFAVMERGCVFNMRSRKCWRPVWYAYDIEMRSWDNSTKEPVRLLGWQGLIEGWDRRPRVKLFAND